MYYRLCNRITKVVEPLESILPDIHVGKKSGVEHTM